MAVYRGTEIIRTNITTTVRKYASGRAYNALEYVYELSGAVDKAAGTRPFLTSITEAKEYIRSELGTEKKEHCEVDWSAFPPSLPPMREPTEDEMQPFWQR